MMERKQILDRFAKWAKTQLMPLADPERYPIEQRDRAGQYQRLMEEARWVYRRLRAGGDAVTILQRFHDSKVRIGVEGDALQCLIDEVRR